MAHPEVAAMQARVTVLALALVLPAAAPSSFAAEEPGRYSMVPAGDGFLRLDSATGAVSICSQKPGGWTCESVADDVLALKQEVDRLSRETEALHDKLAEAEASPKPPGAGKEPRPDSLSIQIPGLAIDEINDFIAKMMRRLQDLVRDLENQQSERAL
jgi:hypothetical protein